MPESNEIMSVEGQLVGLPLAGPESFSVQQLAYLKKALGLDETVLWSNSAGSSTIALSEACTNFERLRLEVSCVTDIVVSYIEVKPLTTQLAFGICGSVPSDGNMMQLCCQYYSSSDGVTFTFAKCTRRWSNGSSAGGNERTTYDTEVKYLITKVTGIHRIAGGN